MLGTLALSQVPDMTRAEEFDAGAAIKEMAAQTAAISNINTISRVSEDLAFWQSVAILGGANGWTFSYNTEGTEQLAWTLRLATVLGDSENEIVRAQKALSRIKIFDDNQKAAVLDLYQDHERLRSVSEQVHSLLIETKGDEATLLYEAKTIQLRRDIASTVYSLSSSLSKANGKMALKARVALK